MIQIIPSLLVPDKQTFLRELRGLKDSVKMLQIDIADGVFVPDKTWADPTVIKNHLEIDCELHLMVADPLSVAKTWEGVSQVKRILVHYESVKDWGETLPRLLALDWDVSIVLNPETPITVLDLNLDIDLLKGVMFMGVHPGKQHQPFIPEVLKKIKALRAKGTRHFVEIDGGVNEDTLPQIIASGVDAICPGSAIFGNERTPVENVGR